jgi:ABC-type lipoprotein release transport system permease subunit
VNDIRNPGDLVKPASRFQTYEPLEQAPMHWLTFTLHSGADPHALEAAARRVVARLDPDLAVFRMETAEEDIQVITHNYALVGWVLTEMAALGLFLSAVGIYGVISNLAIQRTQEIGIRMALGAQAADVRWLVLRNGVILAAAGTMAGLVLALLLPHVLGVVTPEVPGQSLPALAGVAALLALVAILASWLPARRATRVDPIVALRGD